MVVAKGRETPVVMRAVTGHKFNLCPGVVVGSVLAATDHIALPLELCWLMS